MLTMNYKSPPHLPPKSSNLKMRQLSQNLRVIFLSTVLGVLAGITGASIVLGWIWPYVGEGDTWASSKIKSSFSIKQLEDHTQKEMEERMVKIYRKSSIFYGTTYLDNVDYVGEGVVVGTDGWVVFYTNTQFSDYTNWQILDKKGNLYKVNEIYKDPYSSLVYFHINFKNQESQFKVATFFNDKINSGEDVYVFSDGSWHHSFVKYPLYVKSVNPHLDTKYLFRFSLAFEFKTGEIVISKQGRFLGFVDSQNLLMPFNLVSKTLPKALSRNQITYPSLGVEGKFSSETPIVLKDNLQDGFLVMRILKNKTSLRLGDVVLKINGAQINSEDLWSQLVGLEKATLTVLRSGEIVEFETLIFEI